MRFTIVVDGFVIAGNKINMHVGGNRVSTVSDDSPNGSGRGREKRATSVLHISLRFCVFYGETAVRTMCLM